MSTTECLSSDGVRPLILLTGAGNGIGRATAMALGARGYKLGLIDRDEEALEKVIEGLKGEGKNVRGVRADVCDSESLKEAVGAIEAEVGAIEVVVTCAGVGRLSSAMDMDLDGFRQMLEVNVLGVARTIEAVLPGMFARGRGHLVGISSVAGLRGMPWMPGYSASKAAISTYLEALRPSLKLRGVRITTVYPGFVRTGITVATPFRRPVTMLEPEQAAAYLVRAIERKPRDSTFPLSAAVGMGILRRMPNWMFDRCMDHAGPRALTSDF